MQIFAKNWRIFQKIQAKNNVHKGIHVKLESNFPRERELGTGSREHFSVPVAALGDNNYQYKLISLTTYLEMNSYIPGKLLNSR